MKYFGTITNSKDLVNKEYVDNIGEEVSDLKNAIINNANVIFTFTKNDLESGYWAYSTKMERSDRLRNATLTPVKAGTVVKYYNPTQKVYFGVLETPSSGTYLQSTGWISVGASGEITIKYDGYMTYMIEGVDPTTVEDYNVETMLYFPPTQEEINRLSEKITTITGKIPLRFTQYAINPSTGRYYYAANRCATPMLSLPQGVYAVASEDPNLQIMLYDGVLTGGATAKYIFNVTAGTPVGIVVKKSDNSNISYADAQKNVYIEVYEPQELKDKDLNGISLKSLGNEPLVNVRSVGSSRYQSEIWKMPKSGINFQRIMSEDDTAGYCAVMFYRLVDGILVGADDYPYGNILWNDGIPSYLLTKASIYYPYDDDLYFSIIYNNDAAASTRENLFISYGSIQNGNGRVTNLAPASCTYGYMPEPNDDIQGAYPSFTLWYGVGYVTEQLFYGTVIRLSDAKAICCSADLSLLCWWYDNDGVLLGREYGNSLTDYGFTGTNYIDLSKYGMNGYCVVLIRMPFTAKQPVEGQTFTQLVEQTSGGNHMRDYALNNVYIQYYNKTAINHATGLHPVLAQNVELFKNLDCGASFEFDYGGPVTANRPKMIAMPHSAPCFYAGPMYCNSLFQNISLKSYITALKNPNSQVYTSDWNRTGIIMTGFGMVCNNLPPTLWGLPWAARDTTFAQDTFDPPGVTIYKNFDFYTRYNEIKQGDWMVGVNKIEFDTHIVFVSDIIYVNGAAFAIEGIEAYPPMVRYRYFFLDPALERFNLEFSRREPLNDFFDTLVRPDISTLKSMEETFGDMDTDYTVGTLMCNRGTDSVYCATNDHCFITIADTDIEQMLIYKDGVLVETMTLPPDADRISFGDHELKGVDIISVLQEYGSGYYTLKADNSDDVQESFYCAPPQTISTERTAEEIALTLSNSDDIVYVIGNYKPTTGIIPERENFRVRITYQPERINDGVMTFPRYMEYLGDNYEYDWCEAIYKTDYGTYMVRRDEDYGAETPQPKTYINSDGKWVDPIYDT